MLHIIWTILKIIGIILAALLGTLLVVLLLVLFVPIGYSAKADNRNDLLVKAKAWWLFHALHISFTMGGLPSEEEAGSKDKSKDRSKDRSPVIKVRILGIPIIDTSRKKKEKEAEKDVVFKEPEDNGIPELTTQEVSPKPKIEKQKETVVIEETKKEAEKVSTSKVEKNVSEKKSVEETTVKKIKKEKTGEKVSKKKNLKKAEKYKAEKYKKKEKVQGIEKKKFRLSDIFEKIKAFKDNLRTKISNIRQTIENLLGKVELIKAFFKNEENRQGIRKIISSLKGIIKHVLPKKMKGQILFGMADPCTTGQALGVLGIFYPYYGKSVSIEPDFTRQVLEGNIYIKGYIQIFTLCVIGIKLLINTNFRKLIKNFKNLMKL